MLLGGHRRKPIDLAYRIQHCLLAGNGEPIDLLAEAAAVGDDVIDLAVVGEYVNGYLRVEKVLAEVCLDGKLRSLKGQSGYSHTAVGAQTNRAVGSDQVLTADLLEAARLSETHVDDRILDDLLE